MIPRRPSDNPFPFSDIKPYPLLPDPLPSVPQYGLLERLVPAGQMKGTWVNLPAADGPKGLHTTIMPSPGTSSEQVFGVFTFKSQKYTEVLTFEKVAEPVRNRGGTNEQFSGVVKYETLIKDLDQAVQHVENGMYLWLGENNSQSTDYPGTMFRNPSTPKSVREDDGFPVLHAGQLPRPRPAKLHVRLVTVHVVFDIKANLRYSAPINAIRIFRDLLFIQGRPFLNALPCGALHVVLPLTSTFNKSTVAKDINTIFIAY